MASQHGVCVMCSSSLGYGEALAIQRGEIQTCYMCNHTIQAKLKRRSGRDAMKPYGKGIKTCHRCCRSVARARHDCRTCDNKTTREGLALTPETKGVCPNPKCEHYSGDPNVLQAAVCVLDAINAWKQTIKDTHVGVTFEADESIELLGTKPFM